MTRFRPAAARNPYAARVKEGIGFGIVLERLGFRIPFELATKLVGYIAQVTGVGGTMRDLDVTGGQGARLEAIEEVAHVGVLPVDTLGGLRFQLDLAEGAFANERV